MSRNKRKVNKWLLFGVVVLVILLILWLTIFLFWNGETAGVVMQSGEALENATPAR